MRAMNEAGRRGDATDIWVLRDLEQVAVLAGIAKAEEILTRLDVFTLNNAIQQFNLMKVEDAARKPSTTFIAKDGNHLTTVDISEIQSVTLIEMDENNQLIAAHKIMRGQEERTPA